MADLRPTIAPKSDQLNADDLIGTTLTVKITKVALCPEPDQPVAVHFEGDCGKPYKPGKSMRRVMINAWGDESSEYIGRRMTLFRDEKVQFGGHAVGGIRISHMSHIGDREITMALTSSRANRKPYTVKPLVGAEEPTVKATLADRVVSFQEAVRAAPTVEDKKALRKRAAQLFKALDNDKSDFATSSKALDKWFADQISDETPASAPQDTQEAPEHVEAALEPEMGTEAPADTLAGNLDTSGPIEVEGNTAAEGVTTDDTPRPTETVDAPDADTDPASSDSATDASTASQEEVSDEPQVGDDMTRAISREEVQKAIEEADAADDLPPGLGAFADAVEAASEWRHVHEAMAEYFKSDEFRGFHLDRQNHTRSLTWEIARSIHDAPDFTANLTAYRIWLEWMDEPAVIEEVWKALQSAQAFTAAIPDNQRNLTNATEARLTKLTR